MRLLKIGKKIFDLDERTLIMGILNVTPDSFSDGGRFYSVDRAVEHAVQMVRDGADIIDIGGESTRPGSLSVSVDEEINRVAPVLEELVDKVGAPISIDTYKSEVARMALDLGISMINDVTALQGDKKMVNVVAEHDVPVCLMHMKGNPRDMQLDPRYDNVVEEIKGFLRERAEYALFNDVKKENIIVDPGLGFGKRTGRGVEDNITILRNLSEFKELGYPVLVGASRKTFIGNVCGRDAQLPVSDRLEGSLAAAVVAVINGADIVRVHDVKETRRCINLVDSVVKS